MRKMTDQMNWSLLRYWVEELAQELAVWRRSGAGLECCACSEAGRCLGSAAAEGFCVQLTQMRNGQQHRMHQRLAV